MKVQVRNKFKITSRPKQKIEEINAKETNQPSTTNHREYEKNFKKT